MAGPFSELILIFVLLLANGFLAMAEIAIVAARKGRLKSMADEGNEGATLALDLAKSPGHFLSTVQVGITLFGVLSGVIGGARIASQLAVPLKGIPWLAGSADVIALVIVSTVITYLSVIVGELVPKRLALNNPEKIAAWMSRPMKALARVAHPLVSILNASSDILMAVLGVKKSAEPPVSEEEVRVLIDEGLSTGVFEVQEKEMVEGVFELGEQTADDLMTPRARMIWLSLDDTDEENWRRIAGSGRSHFPVYEKTRDNVVGMVSVKSLWANLSLAGQVDLRSLVTPPLFVPTSMPSSALIEEFKRTGKHIALVVDEFGGLQGLVTLTDVMMAIVGNLPEREQRHDPKAVKRADGTWLIDALLDVDEFKKALEIERDLPKEDEDDFSTLGGFLLSRLGHLPTEGEKICWNSWEFEIIDMDRQRIDKVLVRNLPEEEEAEKAEAGVEAKGD